MLNLYTGTALGQSVQTMASLLKRLTTNASIAPGKYTALGTQEPQGQVPDLSSRWSGGLTWPAQSTSGLRKWTPQPTEESTCLSQIPSRRWSQGCNWMWQVGPGISWLTQGYLLCLYCLLQGLLLLNSTCLVLQEKQLQKYPPEHFFVAGMNKYFPYSF